MAYTCSMHPKVVQNEPGTCPICGRILDRQESGAAASKPPAFSPSVFDSVKKSTIEEIPISPATVLQNNTEINKPTPTSVPSPSSIISQASTPSLPVKTLEISADKPITSPPPPPPPPIIVQNKINTTPFVSPPPSGKIPKEITAGTFKKYLPLLLVFAGILLFTFLISYNSPYAGSMLLKYAIMNFMGGFFIVFAGFKLIDLKGFAHGYATYDLLAKPLPAYGYVYPFIELGLGVAMLTGYIPTWLLLFEIALMLGSGAGLLIKMMKREQLQCLCLGTKLKVPLTAVALIENFGMAFLAFLLLPV